MNRTYSLTEFGVKKHETVLSNGLRVIFIEKPFAPIFAEIEIGAGSVFNPSDNGLAHFTEHKLLGGSKTLSIEDFSKIINSVGGYYNASTSARRILIECLVAEKNTYHK